MDHILKEVCKLVCSRRSALEISEVGVGCYSLSGVYGAKDRVQGEAKIFAIIELLCSYLGFALYDDAVIEVVALSLIHI